jgi:hypothetical protein
MAETELYRLLRFQRAALRGNYETGNQAFSMRLRFLTIRMSGSLVPAIVFYPLLKTASALWPTG